MLVLTRKAGESIQIGDDILVTLVVIKGKNASLGVTAPPDIRVTRPEKDAKYAQRSRAPKAGRRSTKKPQPPQSNAGSTSVKD